MTEDGIAGAPDARGDGDPPKSSDEGDMPESPDDGDADVPESPGDGSAANASDLSDEPDTSTYAGLLTAFPYAIRESGSRLFTLYAIASGLLSLVLGFYFAAAVAVAVANTLGATGGTFTFVRSFFVFVAFLVVAPVVGPVLFVAREHRRGRGDVRYDRRMALLGVVYVFSLYLAAVISMPAEFTLDGDTATRPEPSGLFAPVVSVLYAMPPLSSVLSPAVVALAMYLLDRRSTAGAGDS